MNLRVEKFTGRTKASLYSGNEEEDFDVEEVTM